PAGALDDGRIVREEPCLASHVVERQGDDLADRGQAGGHRPVVSRHDVPRDDDAGNGPEHHQTHEREEQTTRGSAPEPELHVRRSPTRWSFSRLVVPRTHIGEPEMMTITSLGCTAPSLNRVASTSSIMSSVVSTFRISREVTPHDSASRRCTSMKGVSAMIGTLGRAWEMSRAEKPDSVNATIARALRTCAAVAAVSEMASAKLAPGRRRRSRSTDRTASSARSATRAITAT